LIFSLIDEVVVESGAGAEDLDADELRVT